MLVSRHKILMSVRERPLPALWLLACLAPYLLFNIVAIPHFHGFELASATHSASVLSNLDQHQHTESTQAGHNGLDCFLCEWTAGSHSSITAPAEITLDSASATTLAVYHCRQTSPHSAVYDGRGPPLSL
jgi:hypothetical protein